MRVPSGIVVVVAVVIAFGTGLPATLSRPAFAQPGAGDAREIAEMARRSYNLGRWQEAIDGFERAYQMTGDPALLYNLAQAHRHMDHIPEALRFYRAYLREAQNGPDRGVAQEQITELERRRPSPAHPPVVPRVSTVPPVAVPPPVASPPPPPPPPVTVPTAEPLAAGPVPAGAETMLSPPPLTVPPDPAIATTTAAVTAAPAPSPQPPLPRWLPWVGAGVTVALVTTAAVVGVSSNKRFDELNSSCGQTSAGCAEGDIAAVKSRTRTANILWAAAGVLAVVTGVGVYVNTHEAGLSGLVRF